MKNEATLSNESPSFSYCKGRNHVTRKYQITIPKEVRRRVGVEIGDKLKVMERSEAIILRKAGEKRSILALAGCYKLDGFGNSMGSGNLLIGDEL